MFDDRLRVIFEYSPVAYCLVDFSGIFIDVNEAAARLVGYSREELKGKKLSELNIITPHQLAKLESSINNWKMGQPSGPNEYILNRKDGSQVFVESWSFPVKSGDQNLALTMVIDVTDRKRAEQALHFHSNLLDMVGQAVIATDLEGRIIYWNRFAETLYGWQASEIIGANLMGAIPAPIWIGKARTAMKKPRRGETRSGEFLVRRKDGTEFPAIVLTTPIRDPQGNFAGVVRISYDISAQKRALELLLQQQRELRNFSRRILSIREEEKRMLSENIHREVGHITGAINLLADSIEKDIRSSNLEAALDSCQKFKSICHDFASNLRRLALDLRPPELDLLGLSSALSNYFREIEKETGLKIEFESNMNEKKIRDGRPIVVFRIVQEAVNNILKHSQANRVRVSLQSHGRMISLAIKDNGRGFAPEKNKKEAGSGMGLRLIREMAESLDGTFEISSSPGKGTELRVSLPAAKPPERDPSLEVDATITSKPASKLAPKSKPPSRKRKSIRNRTRKR
jgi:PAS domain S-box-containing protein